MYKLILLTFCLTYLISESVTVQKQPPSCAKISLKFGRVRYSQRRRMVHYMCNKGYLIAGEKHALCHNGTWDTAPPKCVRSSCIQIKPPANGFFYPSHRGGVLNFFCYPGFELLGPNITYCDGKDWDNQPPSCMDSYVELQTSCDFESVNLCGWTQDVLHDFDWFRGNLQTLSGHLGTGPSYDHTKGIGQDGYYMYIESSSRDINDTARLISPVFSKINMTDACLEFFYHMHGASVGQLRVYVKRISDPWIMEPEKAFFWKSGNHGDQWLKSLTHIGSIDEDFQIIIEAVRGSSYFSDIAIDDVSLLNSCDIEEDTTETDIPYTDELPKIESCLNRCDNDNYIIPPLDTSLLNCGCDETCTDNNTCCPDYIALCVLGDESGLTESLWSSDTTTDTTTDAIDVSETTTTEMTTKNTEKAIANTTVTINKPLTKSTAQTKIFNTTTKLKMPTLIFLKPTTPHEIVRKLPTSTEVIIKKFTKKIPSLPTKTPTTTVSMVNKEGDFIDDIVTIPEVNNEEDKIYFTAPHLASPSSNSIKHVQEEKLIDTKSILIITTSVVFILLIICTAAFFARKYRIIGCGNLKKMHNLSDNSQSDVRFLTSDEILDFNLAYTDD